MLYMHILICSSRFCSEFLLPAKLLTRYRRAVYFKTIAKVEKGLISLSELKKRFNFVLILVFGKF